MSITLLAFLLLQSAFHFQPEQAVYIVALDATRADLGQAKLNLEVERRAGDEFKSQKKFKLSKTINDADFVFFVLVDTESSRTDELALAVTPKDYLDYRTDLLELKNHALWSQSGKEGAKNFGKSILSAYTLGAVTSSVVRDIVKDFHADVLPKKK